LSVLFRKQSEKLTKKEDEIEEKNSSSEEIPDYSEKIA